MADDPNDLQAHLQTYCIHYQTVPVSKSIWWQTLQTKIVQRVKSLVNEIPGFIVPNIFDFNNDQLTGIFTMVMKI